MQRTRTAERDERELGGIVPTLNRHDTKRAQHLGVHNVDHRGWKIHFGNGIVIEPIVFHVAGNAQHLKRTAAGIPEMPDETDGIPIGPVPLRRRLVDHHGQRILASIPVLEKAALPQRNSQCPKIARIHWQEIDTIGRARVGGGALGIDRRDHAAPVQR